MYETERLAEMFKSAVAFTTEDVGETVRAILSKAVGAGEAYKNELHYGMEGCCPTFIAAVVNQLKEVVGEAIEVDAPVCHKSLRHIKMRWVMKQTE